MALELALSSTVQSQPQKVNPRHCLGPSVWRTSFSQRAIPPLSEQFNSLCVSGGGGRREGSAGRNRLPVAEGNRGRSFGNGRWPMGGRTDRLARRPGPSQSPAHRLCMGSPLCSARIRSGRLSPCGHSAAQDGTARACRASELPSRHPAIPASPRYVCGCPAQACEEWRRGKRVPSRIRGAGQNQRCALCTMRNVYLLNSSRLDSDALRGGDGPTLEESGRAGEWLGGGAIFMSLAKRAIAKELLAKAECGMRNAECGTARGQSGAEIINGAATSKWRRWNLIRVREVGRGRRSRNNTRDSLCPYCELRMGQRPRHAGEMPSGIGIHF
jgi:hypothetical protein